MRLGQKIQELRKQNNLSQENLAENLAVSRQAISKWELDESIPDTDKIIKLSNLFQVSTDYLLCEDIKSLSSKTENGNYNKKSITFDAYKQFIGRWVKIFLNDKEYQGLYQVAMIAIDNNFILFEDKKGKKGLVKIESIISISDANIYKDNPSKVPSIISQDMTGHGMFEYFQGRHCKIHFICKSWFTTPQGCYDVLIEKATSEGILVIDHKKRSAIKLDKILVMTEW